ncbi:MAG: hypothetical protein ACRDRQ_23370 [Pseudonocardiaceae bacterium]
MVDLLAAYSNRSDLREQLQQATAILSKEAQRDDETGFSADGEVRSAPRWWSLRDRFCPEDLQTMIDLYRSGTTAKQVAEKVWCQRAQPHTAAAPARRTPRRPKLVSISLLSHTAGPSSQPRRSLAAPLLREDS